MRRLLLLRGYLRRHNCHHRKRHNDKRYPLPHKTELTKTREVMNMTKVTFTSSMKGFLCSLVLDSQIHATKHLEQTRDSTVAHWSSCDQRNVARSSCFATMCRRVLQSNI